MTLPEILENEQYWRKEREGYPAHLKKLRDLLKKVEGGEVNIIVQDGENNRQKWNIHKEDGGEIFFDRTRLDAGRVGLANGDWADSKVRVIFSPDFNNVAVSYMNESENIYWSVGNVSTRSKAWGEAEELLSIGVETIEAVLGL